MSRITWVVRTKDGRELAIKTLAGLGPVEALSNAGIMRADIDWIRPSTVALVEDIGAWRRGEA